ncbi:unnamed protein product [Phaeothamnion confervicola]
MGCTMSSASLVCHRGARDVYSFSKQGKQAQPKQRAVSFCILCRIRRCCHHYALPMLGRICVEGGTEIQKGIRHEFASSSYIFPSDGRCRHAVLFSAWSCWCYLLRPV